MKKNLADEVPACVRERINNLEAESNPAKPKIYEYTYHGKKVYYIQAYRPDAYGDLLDSTCTVICHPDGGITGRGDGRCTDFFSTRTNEKLLGKSEDK